MFKCLFHFIVRLLISICVHMSCVCNCLFLITLTRNPTDCNHFSCNGINSTKVLKQIMYFQFQSHLFIGLQVSMRASNISKKWMYCFNNIMETFRKDELSWECSGHIFCVELRVKSNVPVKSYNKANVERSS